MSERDNPDLQTVRRLLKRLQLESGRERTEGEIQQGAVEPGRTDVWDTSGGHSATSSGDTLQPPPLPNPLGNQQVATTDERRAPSGEWKTVIKSAPFLALTVVATSVALVWQISSFSTRQTDQLSTANPNFPEPARFVEQTPIERVRVPETGRAQPPVVAQSAPAPTAVIVGQSSAVAAKDRVSLPEARSIDLDEGAQIASIKRGEDLLRTGNIAQARLAFVYAANAGNPSAALRLGDTFDPLRLAELGTVGTVADLSQSIHWYEVADELGSPHAKSRLLELANRNRLP